MNSFLLQQENVGIIYFTRRDWHIRKTNTKAGELLRLAPEDLRRKRLTDVFHIPKEILTQILNTKVRLHETVVETILFLSHRSVFISVFVRESSEEFLLLFFSLEETKERLFLPQLRYFIKNIRFAGMMLDNRGNLMYCSQMFSKITGYETGEIFGKNFFTLFLQKSERTFYRRIFRQALKENKIPSTLQLPIRCKDGHIVPMLWNLTLLTDASAQTLGFSGIGVTISYITVESKKTLHNEKLETLIATISSMFAQTPTYKVDETINRTLQIVGEYAGVDRSYVFLFRDNQKVMDNTHEWCAQGIEPQIENLQGVPSKIVPWWMQRLLKHEIIHIPRVSELPPEAHEEKEILEAQDIQSLIVVPMIENNELIGFIGFDSVRMPKFWPPEDIDLLKIISSIFVSSLKRKSTELSLAATERKYRLLFNTAPDLIFILNVKGEIESLNPAFTVITGQNIEDWIGRPFFDLIIEEDRPAFRKRFQECLSGTFQLPHEIRIQTPQGFKIVETICSEITFSGKKHGVYGIARDITDRKLLEENLHHAERMKSIGLLAGGIAHDFNNILGIILGHYTLIKQNINGQEELNIHLEAIRQAVERGKTLVQNLLTFARKKEPNYEILDLNSEIKKVINLLQQTTPRSITYQLNLSAQKLYILSDQIQIHQLLVNLCLNAIDAIRTEQQSGTIVIATEKIASKDVPAKFNALSAVSHVHLIIQDTGIGMSAQELKFIFDPFYTSKEGGTGLGLSVVFGIVKSLHGYIDVESTAGKGTTFHVYLPLSEKKKISRKNTSKSGSKIFFGSAHIFLIEDDILLSQMLHHLLKNHGYKVEVAYSGEKAVEKYVQIKDSIDLVILDFDLPEKDGLLVAQALRRLKPEVKIIITSGFLEPHIKQQFERMGKIYFFEKPYDPEKILEEIPVILSNRLTNINE